jgi:membrane-bound ClpP family serine protease
LASDRLSGVRTVAFLPSSVKGHACLAVMACEEIIVAADAEFGEAGTGESHVDSTMRNSYQEIAARRLTIQPAVAVGMLDRNVAVHKAVTLEGDVKYVLDDELKQLQERGALTSFEPLVAAGDLASFTGNELRNEHRWASHLANDRDELLSALELPPGALEQDPSLGGGWRPIRVDLRGHITSKHINWVTTSIKEKLSGAPDGATNFICLVIDSPGGSLTDSLRFANFLASLDSTQVRTVAFVPSEARGDAAIIAWSCDQLVIAEDATLGGAGASNLSKREAPELREALRAIAQEKQRDWSLAVGLVDPNFQVYEYSLNGDTQKRYFSEEELQEQSDPDRWQSGSPMNLKDGLQGSEALTMQLAKHVAANMAEVQQLYHIDEDLPGIEANWAHLAIEQLSSPQLAGTLLFVAWFAMIIEVSQPGVSVAGFLSALCFLLFFWSNFLHGTAAWLEVLLFVAGIGSLIIEIFVLPGFGVFGFGGACLVIASLVLASQTFIVPRNSYQFGQFSNSLMMVAVGMAGAFVSLVAVRKYLPEAPVFKRLVLSTDEDELEERAERELLADYRHLMGKRGTTMTQLTPSGKARFGDDVVDVISDGEAIPQGADVFVADVRGNRVLVEIVPTARAV